MGGAAGTLLNNDSLKNAGNVVAGNMFLDLPGTADALKAFGKGLGSPLTWGRRTTNIVALNLAGKGGVPQALSASGRGARSFLSEADKALSFGLTFAEKAIVDAAFAAGEAIACSH